MEIKHRIFISMPADEWLSDKQNELKWALVDKIKGMGYVPEVITSPRHIPNSIAAGMAWSAQNVAEVMKRCVGAVFIGIPRWQFETEDGHTLYLPTDFCAYEGALANALNLPMLVVAQKNIAERVVFNYNFGNYIGRFDPNQGKEWLDSADFNTAFSYWTDKLQKRRDIFLGYCSNSTVTAKLVKTFLNDRNVSVLDWQTDFAPGESILQQIINASALCSMGIFLFTKDDSINSGDSAKAAPRDNVVFEAGYFIHAKEKKNVLIVLEEGAKMPADLGGDIYASLKDKSNIDSIQGSIISFIGNY